MSGNSNDFFAGTPVLHQDSCGAFANLSAYFNPRSQIRPMVRVVFTHDLGILSSLGVQLPLPTLSIRPPTCYSPSNFFRELIEVKELLIDLDSYDMKAQCHRMQKIPNSCSNSSIRASSLSKAGKHFQRLNHFSRGSGTNGFLQSHGRYEYSSKLS